MIKFLRVSSPILLLLLTLSFTDVKNDEGPEWLLGYWEYEAPTIGLKYQKGSLHFVYEEGVLKGKVIFWNRELPMQNIIYEDNKVRSHILIEGRQIDLFLKFETDAFKGTVSNPQGFIRITGSKVKV